MYGRHNDTTPGGPSRSTVRMVVQLTILVAIGFGAVVMSERFQTWQDDRILLNRLTSEARLTLPPPQLPVPRATSQDAGLRFAEWTDSGVDFTYENGARDTYHLAETLGGGVAATDVDRDGHADLIFVNGGSPFGTSPATDNHCALYRRTEGDRFTNLADLARCHWSAYGHGCAVGDINNDGFDDLFFTGYGATELYLNLGDGTFLATAEEAGVFSDRWSATACFGDLDRDGDLDLYVTAYADVPATLPTRYCEEAGVRIHCHPHHYEAVPDLVFENLGDGRFHDRSTTAGIAEQVQYGLGVVIADLDHDLVPEIFVANDGDRNLLFVRRDDWRYEEIGTTAGVAYSGQGETMGAMGIACGDFDGNGLLDLMTTNFIRERNILFSNEGNLLFFDRSAGGLIEATSTPQVGWSAVPFDADRDGQLDLFVANGHVTPAPNAAYKQLPLLYRAGAGGDWELAADPGEYFATPWLARGALAVDLNADDQLDLVVSHIHDPAALLINRSPPAGNGIRLSFVGTVSNRSAAGVRIEYVVAGQPRVAQRILSGGYLSSSTREWHAGLGSAEAADAVRIHWPSGIVQSLGRVVAGESRLVVEPRAADTPIE